MHPNLAKAIPLLLFIFLVLLLPSLPVMSYDFRNYFQVWALFIRHHGLANAYGSGTDYMPVFQYVLGFFGLLAGTDDGIARYMPLVKSVSLIADFTAIWYVCLWVGKRRYYATVLVLCVCNMGFIYNTLIWGQIDGLLSACIFITLYYAAKGRSALSACFMVLAFNVKVQAIVIFPVWSILVLCNYASVRGRRNNALWNCIAAPVLVMIIVQALLLTPFALGHYPLANIYYAFVSSVDRFRIISVNAANIWSLFLNDAGLLGNDAAIVLFGLTYKQLGLLLFFSGAFAALIPLFRWLLLIFSHRATVPPPQLVWYSSALVYMLFYYCNTQMHERYCHPALLFMVASACYARRYWPLALFSVAYFLTLERSVQILHLPNYNTVIFSYPFLSVLNLVIIAYLFITLYGRTLRAPAPHAGHGSGVPVHPL